MAYSVHVVVDQMLQSLVTWLQILRQSRAVSWCLSDKLHCMHRPNSVARWQMSFLELQLGAPPGERGVLPTGVLPIGVLPIGVFPTAGGVFPTAVDCNWVYHCNYNSVLK